MKDKKELYKIAKIREETQQVKSARTSYCCFRTNQLSIGQTNPNRAELFRQAHEEYEEMEKEWQQTKV